MRRYIEAIYTGDIQRFSYYTTIYVQASQQYKDDLFVRFTTM